jgi:hypothetical protein
MGYLIEAASRCVLAGSYLSRLFSSLEGGLLLDILIVLISVNLDQVLACETPTWRSHCLVFLH